MVWYVVVRLFCVSNVGLHSLWHAPALVWRPPPPTRTPPDPASLLLQPEQLAAIKNLDAEIKEYAYQTTILEEQLGKMNVNLGTIEAYRAKEAEYLGRMKELEAATAQRDEVRCRWCCCRCCWRWWCCCCGCCCFNVVLFSLWSQMTGTSLTRCCLRCLTVNNKLQDCILPTRDY